MLGTIKYHAIRPPGGWCGVWVFSEEHTGSNQGGFIVQSVRANREEARRMTEIIYTLFLKNLVFEIMIKLA